MIVIVVALSVCVLAAVTLWPSGRARQIAGAEAGAVEPGVGDHAAQADPAAAGEIGRRSRRRAVALVTTLALPLATLPAKAASGTEIVDKTVTFTVVNKNDSFVPCEADGKTYVLHGSLIAPASVLSAEHQAVTLYPMGGLLSGPHFWRMRPGGLESFDYGLAMARLGHATVAVEEVGYGESVVGNDPDGNLVCQGSHADAMHQMVMKLRSGDYTFGDSDHGPQFDRVALAGISYSSQFANAAVYSFPDNGGVDALILTGYAEPISPQPAVAAFLALYASQCATGRNKYDDGTGPAHYTKVPAGEATAYMFNDPDPAAAAEFERLIEADPCGQASSYPARIATDAAHLGDITVPVLLADGEFDEIYGFPGPQLYFQRFTGSSDRTLMIFPGAGHVFWLETQRARWIAMMSGWLTAHDL